MLMQVQARARIQDEQHPQTPDAVFFTVLSMDVAHRITARPTMCVFYS